MRGNNKALLVRALIFGSHRSSMNSFSRRLHENLISNPSKTSHPSKSLSNFTTKFHFSTPYLQLFQRTLSSSSSSGASNIVLVKSDEELNSGMKNVQEKSSPAVFYFTATWCGPCKFISPVIEELSKKYPHATIYKVDIDTEGLQNALANLNIAAVPTLEFYKNGKKETTIVGADVAKLKNTMESLYRED
ncbi:PREDICTED: thioredoxin O2, mitochondrial isoform X1 [Populus euphratica]|uniref:Thioredoxin O2, mitochondrial isoform X1 n=1 Tax=Populus euphratica TaxID=75702 RepID=A0AAJ6XY16_POPEU|nr:PREDICTED: thioredoxin O2, mitochondrial isoform X1 [Populus euphratica]